MSDSRSICEECGHLVDMHDGNGCSAAIDVFTQFGEFEDRCGCEAYAHKVLETSDER